MTQRGSEVDSKEREKKNFNQTFQCDIFLIEESREKMSISSFSRSESSARKNLLMAY